MRRVSKYAVAAHNRLTWVSQSKLRTHNVYNTLINRIQIIQSNTKILTVLGQGVDLLLRDRICDVKTILCRYIMVHGSKSKLRTTDLAATQTQTFERLWRRYFVNQMQVNIQNSWLAFFLMNHVVIPNFFEHRFFTHHYHPIVHYVHYYVNCNITFESSLFQDIISIDVIGFNYNGVIWKWN